MASIRLQTDVWESYGKSAKVGLNTGCILIGILNHPVNSLMKEPIWRSISRGVNDLRFLQADHIFCPFILAHPSIPDLRHRFLQLMVLLVSVRSDKKTTTDGLGSN